MRAAVVLVVSTLLLALAACPLSERPGLPEHLKGAPDGGAPDAGFVDAGEDAGPLPDAGGEDAGDEDAGALPDAGGEDAGALPDAGGDGGSVVDAGADAGSEDAGLEPDGGLVVLETTVYEVKRDGLPAGTRVLLRDMIVTAIGGGGFWLQLDPASASFDTADYAGIFVSSAGSVPFERGDRLEVEATVAESEGRAVLEDPDWQVVSQGPEVEPIVLPVQDLMGQVAQGAAASLEGSLVRFGIAIVTELEPVPAAGDTVTPRRELVIDGGLRVDDTLFALSPGPDREGALFEHLAGVLDFRHEHLRLYPRDMADADLAECTAPLPPSDLSPDHVVSLGGDDTTLSSRCIPFQTLAAALSVAQSEDVVWLLPGEHGVPTAAPLRVPAGVTVVGQPVTQGGGAGTTPSTRIHGAGQRPNGTRAALELEPQARLVGLEIDTPAAGDATIQVYGVVFLGSASVEHSTFLGDRGVHMGESGGLVAHSRFENVGESGVELGATDVASEPFTVRDNTCTHPVRCVVASNADVTIRDNVFRARSIGVDLWQTSGTLAGNTFERPGGWGDVAVRIDGGSARLRDNTFANQANLQPAILVVQGTPDLGTGMDPGGNDFQSTMGPAIVHRAGTTIPAMGNAFRGQMTVLCADAEMALADIVVEGAGSVRWGAHVSAVCPP